MLRRLTGSLLLVACAVAPAPPPAPTPPPSASRDYDRDGYPDPRDRCPREPGGEPHGCPDPDEDSDGFPRSADRCPNLHGVAPDGCPPPDGDRDEIPDSADRCLDKLETRNGYEDQDGCPDKLPKDLAKYIGTIPGVTFVLDQDVLKTSSHRVLNRAAEVLKKYPAVRIEVVNHLDNSGAPTYGKDLSVRRAQAVKQYLVNRGLDPQRIETRGAGPDEPVDTNKTAAGRARNRRTEFTILIQ